MSSNRVGVQVLIRQHSPLAHFIHCSGHCLTLLFVIPVAYQLLGVLFIK